MSVIIIHPYLADLPIFDAEVDAIAESISEVGLLHPVTLDTEGQVIGGRHRLAACAKAKVDPTFETHEGDPLAFMAHDNAARKHQTTGQRAAESALLLCAAGLRDGGRWDGARGRGLIRPDDGTNQKTWNNLHAQAGTILDHLGRGALVSVAAGDALIADTYEKACRARDAEQQRKEREAAEAKEEADAETFVKDRAPDLAKRVDGSDLMSYREALDLWERRNREEAGRIAKAEAAERRKERERLDGIKRDANRVLNFLDGLAAAANLHRHPFRSEVLASLPPHHRTRILSIEKEATWPTTL